MSKKPRRTRRTRVPPRRKQASVPCPRCRGPTWVLRTGREGGSTVRVRVCRRGHRFGTIEAALKGRK